MKARTHDPRDQLGHSASSPWDDHGSIAAMLALGMVWLGVSLADVPVQPANKRFGNEIATSSTATDTTKGPQDSHGAVRTVAPSEPGRLMPRSIALNP